MLDNSRNLSLSTPSLVETALSHAESMPDATAFREKSLGLWVSWTWAEVRKEISLCSNLLLSLGAKSESTIGICGANSIRCYFYMFAAQRIGAVPLPIHPNLSAGELAKLHESAEFDFLVVGDDEQLSAALATNIDLSAIVMIAGDAIIENADRAIVAGDSRHDFKDAALPDQVTNSIAVVIHDYDAGGQTQCLPLTHHGIHCSAARLCQRSGVTKNDEFASFLPMSWLGDFTQFAMATLSGAAMSVAESSLTVRSDLRILAPTVLLAPSSFYRRILSEIDAEIERTSAFKRMCYQKVMSPPKSKGVMDLIFSAPLRNMLGLNRIRMAFAAEGRLSDHVYAGYNSLGINLTPVFGSAALGGYVSTSNAMTPRNNPLDDPFDGVKINLDADDRVIVENLGASIPAYGADIGQRADEGSIMLRRDVNMPTPLPSKLIKAAQESYQRLEASLLMRSVLLVRHGDDALTALIVPDLKQMSSLSRSGTSEYGLLKQESDVIEGYQAMIAEVADSITHFAFVRALPNITDRSITRNGRIIWANLVGVDQAEPNAVAEIFWPVRGKIDTGGVTL